MTRDEARILIIDVGVMPVIRVTSAKHAIAATEAVHAGGVPIVEITMTVPGAVDLIRELSQKFGFNFYGCDICQDVCPWNQKTRKKEKLPTSFQSGVIDPHEVLRATDEELLEQTKDTAMSRAKPKHLKRNARIILQNQDS